MNSFDLIITLCGDANDKCLTFDENIKHIHWDIKDPAKLIGNDEQISKGFSKIRDEMKELLLQRLVSRKNRVAATDEFVLKDRDYTKEDGIMIGVW